MVKSWFSQVKKKKRQAVISDSDSDEEIEAPVSKKPSKPSEKFQKERKAEASKEKLKEIKAADFFATNSKESKTELTPSKKRKDADKTSGNGESSSTETTEVAKEVQKFKKQRTESPEAKPSLSAKLAGKVDHNFFFFRFLTGL